MIDVHDDLLYYCVVAWADDFTGYVIDYGTFPEQIRKRFSKSDRSNVTLQKKFTGAKRHVAIQAGVELLFKRWKHRESCDIAGEFSFDELLQLIEMHRTTDGDILIIKHADLKLQLVEGDRVRNPDDVGMDQEWYHGLHKNEYGRVIEYAISKRQEMGGFKHEKIISRDHAWLVGRGMGGFCL
jgi:hypothetical protein